MDYLTYLNKALDLVTGAVDRNEAERQERIRKYIADGKARDARDNAMAFLRQHVRRLCKVTYAPDLELASKAHAFYSALPTEDGNDFAEEWLAESLQMWAGQFGGRAPRPAVTAAFAEVMREMED